MRPELGEYRIVPFEDSPDADGKSVLEFWEREHAIPPGKDGRERLGEVSFVALDGGGSVAGVSTHFLRRNEQLRTDVWHLRVFVGSAHRRSALGVLLLGANRRHLEERFVAGEDTRGSGLMMEIENPGLKGRSQAIWEADWAPGVRHIFIGENASGHHVRIHWFQGARAPLPARELSR